MSTIGTETKVETYLVGGAVRDSIMGIDSKDYDFVIVGPESFEEMVDLLREQGFTIKPEMLNPEFFTARAIVPKDHPFRQYVKGADFVLARRDGPSTDGRHPDYTEPDDLKDDLARRDFTVNSVAKAVDGPDEGMLIDPFMGISDIRTGTLRFVGDPMKRIIEDGLRVLRGFRFMVTKDLTPVDETWEALVSREAAKMLHGVSVERVYDELLKMFTHDTVTAMGLLVDLPGYTQEAIFRGGLHLRPSLKGKDKK